MNTNTHPPLNRLVTGGVSCTQPLEASFRKSMSLSHQSTEQLSSTSSAALLFNSQKDTTADTSQSNVALSDVTNAQVKLAEILPEDLLRNSNEDMLLTQAMARVRRASVKGVNMSEIQNDLANEIKSRL